MKQTPARRRHQKRRNAFLRPAIVVISLTYILSMLLWPLPSVSATIDQPKTIQGNTITLPWPSGAQSALGAVGYGALDANGAEKSVPIASITKLVTALTVLEQKPLKIGEKGPAITFTQEDAVRYNEYLSQEGVVGPVTPGQSISQYDLMQIMLVASANNYADTAALWAYGSMDAYLAAANSYLAKHGFTHTHVADAAGFSPQSVSTAKELVQLGELVLADPVLKTIVAKPRTTVSGYGTFYSTNLLADEDNIIGIKTGTTDEAGNCLLYAGMYNRNGKEIIIIGATLNAPERYQLAREAYALLGTAQAGFKEVTIAAEDQTFATYMVPWSDDLVVRTPQTQSSVVWNGHDRHYRITAPDAMPGTIPVPRVTMTSGEMKQSLDIEKTKKVVKPSWGWRLTHPYQLIRGS